MIAAAVDPARARRDVGAILRGSRYHPKGPPRPLDALLSWLDDHLQPVWHALGKVFGPVGRFLARVWGATIGALPGPIAVAVILVAVAVVIAFVARALDQRAAAAARHDDTSAPPVLESAAELEARAEECERAGDLDAAVRLRFRGGLVRLEHDAHRIVNRPGLTTRAVRDELASSRFDGLADTFESVAYGGDDAERDDVDTARREWPVVVGEARRRG